MIARYFRLEPMGLARASCSLMASNGIAEKPGYPDRKVGGTEYSPLFLATCSYQSSFAHHQVGLVARKHDPVEIGPDLLSSNFGRPAGLPAGRPWPSTTVSRASTCRSEAGQRRHRRSQKRRISPRAARDLIIMGC